MNAAIKAISYYLPDESPLTNEELSKEHPDWAVDKISDVTGIYTRYIASPEQCASDLGIKSTCNLFEEYNINPKDIDFILFCTQSPDYFLPTTACLVQDILGIPQSAGALDFNLGCSGFIYGLSIAKGLIESGDIKNVLLITSETYSKFIHPMDKSCKTIFGDASASCLISSSEEGSISNFVFGTDGKGANNLIVKDGGMRNKLTGESRTDITDTFGNVTNAASLYMNGLEIFNFTLRVVPPLINNLYTKSGLNESDIDLFIFHQANKYVLDTLRKKMKIPEEKFYQYVSDCGNTVSSTIPIALCNAIKDGKAKKGNKILLAGFGVGYSWAGCIIQI